MKYKETMKKTMAVVLSLAMVATSATAFEVDTKADAESRATTIALIQNGTSNLALNKHVRVLPNMQPNEGGSNKDGVKLITDGNVDSTHIATAFNTTNTSYVIDLGDTYNADSIDQIVSQYKEKNAGDTPVKGYSIQYSANGVEFYDVKTVAAQTDADNPTWAEEGQSNLDVQVITEEEKTALEGKAVQYVKLYYPDSYTWGIQVRELAVLDTDGDVVHVDVPRCDDAASVEVRSDDYNSISYKVIAGDNQEGYVYNVYLDDGDEVGTAVLAGETYTISDIKEGTHTLKVVAIYDGKASLGITSDEVTVVGVASLITGTKNIASTNNNDAVKVVSVSSYYNETHTIDTAKVVLDGSISSGEGNTVALRTAANQQPAEIVIDLGNNYKPAQFDKVLLAYSNPRTYAATTKVSFSSDNENYTEVATSTGYACLKDAAGAADINSVNIDKDKISTYLERSVRYVKVELSDGANGWGYVVNEIGITLTVDVSDATIITKDNPIVAPDIASKSYTGETLTADIVDTDDYSVTKNEGGIDVGSYDVVLALKNTDNSYWSDDENAEKITKTLSFEITKATNQWTTELGINGWTYGEEAKTPSGAAKFGEVVFTYGETEDGEFTSVVPKNAGNYFVKAEVAGTDNYEGMEATTKAFKIEKADKDAPAIDTFTVVDSTLEENADGKISGITAEMEYRAEGEEGYTSVAEGQTELENVLSGKYYVRYKETANYKASEDTEVVVDTGRKLQVTLISGTGYTLEVANAESNEVEYGAPYTFKVVVAKGYEKGSTFVVKANGQVVEADSEGIYKIESVTVDTEVTVEGVEIEVTTVAPTTKIVDPTKQTTAPKTTTKKALKATKVSTASKKKAGKKVKITFKRIKGAKKYQVQISTTKKFRKVIVKRIVKKVKVTITHKALKNKKKLYVRVKAVGAKKWSKAKKIKIKM